jgi:ribosomal-protein-alanine N-acetyltransferase
VTAALTPLPLPDPPLVGDGFRLRPWVPADAPALAAAWTDPEVVRWTGVPPQHDEAAAARWIDGDAHRRQRGLALDLVVDVDGAVAGEVGLAGRGAGAGTVEVGWWVAPEHRGRGLAAAAVRAVAEWATAELHVDRLVARCHPENPASSGVARRAGFAEVAGSGSGPEAVWCYPGPEGGTVPT